MLLVTLLVFVMITAIGVMLGLQLWARPKAAIDRVTAVTVEPTAVAAHPSLAWRELVKKLGTLVHRPNSSL